MIDATRFLSFHTPFPNILYSIPGPFIFCFWLLDSTPGVNVIYPPVSERVSTVGIILFYNLTWVSFGVIGF